MGPHYWEFAVFGKCVWSSFISFSCTNFLFQVTVNLNADYCKDPCKKSFVHIGDYIYYVFKNRERGVNFDDAKRACKARHSEATLVTISSAVENEIVRRNDPSIFYDSY